MITAQEFVARWHFSALVRTTPIALDGINLPEVSKDFLVEAGLPKVAVSLCFDLLEQGLPMLGDVEETWYIPPGLESCRVIGTIDGGGVYFYIDEANGGCLAYCIPGEEDNPVYGFLNSSVPQLAEFLLVTQTFDATEPDSISHEEEVAKLTKLEEQLKQIDANAVDVNSPLYDDEPYWSALIWYYTGRPERS